MGSRCFVRSRADLAAEIAQSGGVRTTVRLHVTGRAAVVAVDRAQRIVPEAAATVPERVTGLPTVLAARRAAQPVVAVP